jgi:hypothetical protein
VPVHCFTSAAMFAPGHLDQMNIAFRTGTGGLHSAEN